MKHSLFSPLQTLLDQSLTPGALRLLLVSVLAWSPVHAETESSNTSSASSQILNSATQDEQRERCQNTGQQAEDTRHNDS
ncbi:hypothetical protein [Parathalassolituus penaei]|uniref:Uncharacterized protein n=1 Tax=Parathalassolituus penaei TaxID=2997323 RepID=A0A9X3EA82_9GAMM|nr:hypothetical protein [Parathalassolituus penaei]MCY0963782.1 hypothetical protein [Parathalassolituus penaei]